MSAAVKLTVAFVAVSAMALLAGLILYFDSHLTPVKAEGLLQVRVQICRHVRTCASVTYIDGGVTVHTSAR